jgi:hypothetical protein
LTHYVTDERELATEQISQGRREANQAGPLVPKTYHYPVTSSYTIAVVGMGPRGLSILERILAHAAVHPSLSFDLILCDPGTPGPGCHSREQSEELLMNTLASQVTQFPSVSEGDAVGRMLGPTFDEWVKASVPSVAGETSISMHEVYYPRALFGRYLHDAYQRLIAESSPNVMIRHVAQEVTGARRAQEGWTLFAGTEVFEGVHFVHLATGHDVERAPGAIERGASHAMTHARPIATVSATATNTESVAVEGLGLMAIDAIVQLTLGRGGRFEQDSQHDELRYVPSGREPHIIAYSRSGLPLMARPVSQKKLTSQPPAAHFTEEVVQDLRRQKPIDFESQVLPLLVKEMEAAYNHSATLREASEAPDRGLTASRMPHSRASATPAFSWDSLVNPIPADVLRSQAAYAAFLADYMRADVKEAQAGDIGSPIKAACNVLRDMRERIASVVDFDGLTDASHC